MSTTIPTVDGYPLHASDPDFATQQLINRTLDNCRQFAPLHGTLGQLYPDLCRLSDGSSWLGPVLKRLDWNLRENPDGVGWAAHFGPMINLILMSTESATEDQLFFLCEWAGFLRSHHCNSLADKITTFAWKLLLKSGLSDLALDQLRKVQDVFREPGISAPALMRMGWIFFRADNYRNDGDPCWSAGVRRDLRAMAKEQRKNWLA